MEMSMRVIATKLLGFPIDVLAIVGWREGESRRHSMAQSMFNERFRRHLTLEGHLHGVTLMATRTADIMETGDGGRDGAA